VHVCVAMVYTLIVESSQLKVIKSICNDKEKCFVCISWLLSLARVKFFAAQIILGWRNATNLGSIRFWLELDPMCEQHLVY
jgi:hypothetical protein